MKEWHLGVKIVGENDFLNNKSRVEFINISHKDHHECGSPYSIKSSIYQILPHAIITHL